MYRMGLVNSFEETKSWKTFIVSVKIRAPDSEWAKKLISNGFDRTMSYEDKGTHIPEIVKIIEEK